jgi:hypothetical protein
MIDTVVKSYTIYPKFTNKMLEFFEYHYHKVLLLIKMILNNFLENMGKYKTLSLNKVQKYYHKIK